MNALFNWCSVLNEWSVSKSLLCVKRSLSFKLLKWKVCFKLIDWIQFSEMPWLPPLHACPCRPAPPACWAHYPPPTSSLAQDDRPPPGGDPRRPPTDAAVPHGEPGGGGDGQLVRRLRLVVQLGWARAASPARPPSALDLGVPQLLPAPPAPAPTPPPPPVRRGRRGRAPRARRPRPSPPGSQGTPTRAWRTTGRPTRPSGRPGSMDSKSGRWHPVSLTFCLLFISDPLDSTEASQVTSGVPSLLSFTCFTCPWNWFSRRHRSECRRK